MAWVRKLIQRYTLNGRNVNGIWKRRNERKKINSNKIWRLNKNSLHIFFGKHTVVCSSIGPSFFFSCYIFPSGFRFLFIIAHQLRIISSSLLLLSDSIFFPLSFVSIKFGLLLLDEIGSLHQFLYVFVTNIRKKNTRNFFFVRFVTKETKKVFRKLILCCQQWCRN